MSQGIGPKPPAPRPQAQPQAGDKPKVTGPFRGLAGEGKAALDGARRILRSESRAKGGAGGGVKIPEAGGRPLPGGVRSSMERQLGSGLGNVKIHTSGESAKAATGLGARAFTVGSDVHFNSGEFDPSSKEGKKLLAHELTHVVQGEKSGVQRKSESAEDDKKKGGVEVSDPNEPAEQEADAVAEQVAEGDEGAEAEGKEGEAGEKKAAKPGEAKADEKKGDEKKGEEKPEKPIAAKLQASTVARRIYREAMPGEKKKKKGDEDKADGGEAQVAPGAETAEKKGGEKKLAGDGDEKAEAKGDDKKDAAKPDEQKAEAEGDEKKDDADGEMKDDAKAEAKADDQKDAAKPDDQKAEAEGDEKKDDANGEMKDDAKADDKKDAAKPDDQKAEAKGDDKKDDAKGEKKDDAKGDDKKDAAKPDDQKAEAKGDDKKDDAKGEKKDDAKGDDKKDAAKPDDQKAEAKGDDKKDDAKGEKKDDAKGDEKADAKGEKKDDAKGDEKADAKGDEKADAKGDEKADAKGDEKADAKGDEKADAKDEKADAKGGDEKADAKGGDEKADAKDEKADAKGDEKGGDDSKSEGGEDKAEAKGEEKPVENDPSAPMPSAAPPADPGAGGGEGGGAPGAAAAGGEGGGGEAAGGGEQPVMRKIYRTPAAAAPAAPPAPAAGGSAPAGAAPAATAPKGPPPPSPDDVAKEIGEPPEGDGQPKPAPPSPDRADIVAKMAAARPIDFNPGHTLAASTAVAQEKQFTRAPDTRAGVDAKMEEFKTSKPAAQPNTDVEAAQKAFADEVQGRPAEFETVTKGTGTLKTGGHPAAAGQANPAKAKTPPALPTGPEPEPDLSGMEMKTAKDAFITAARQVEKDWVKLKGPHVRGTVLGEAALAALTGPGEVGPTPDLEITDIGAASGYMLEGPWKLQFNINMFKDKEPDPTAPPGTPPPVPDVVSPAGFAYHEARHAEQWHKVARVLAGKYRRSPARIKAKMVYMNQGAIDDAHGKPIGDKGPVPAEFLDWYRSIYGHGAQDRVKTLNDLTTYTNDIEAKGKARDKCGNDTVAKQKENAEIETKYVAKDVEVKGADTELKTADEKVKQKDTEKTGLEEKERKSAADWWKLQQAHDKAEPLGKMAEKILNDKKPIADEKKTARDKAREDRDMADALHASKWMSRDRCFKNWTPKYEEFKQLFDAFQAAPDAEKDAKGKAAIDYHKNTLKPLSAAHDAAKAAQKKAEEDFKKAEEDLKKAEDALTAADQEYKAAFDSWEPLKTDYEKAVADLTKADADYKKAEADLAQATAELDDLQKKAGEAKTKWEGLSKELQKINDDWIPIYAEKVRLENEYWNVLKPAYDAARPDYDKAYAAYRALPEEKDAWDLQELIEAEYRNSAP